MKSFYFRHKLKTTGWVALQLIKNRNRMYSSTVSSRNELLKKNSPIQTALQSGHPTSPSIQTKRAFVWEVTVSWLQHWQSWRDFMLKWKNLSRHQHFLHRFGLFGRMARRKLLLKKANIKSCLGIARSHVTKPETLWKKMLWSTELWPEKNVLCLAQTKHTNTLEKKRNNCCQPKQCGWSQIQANPSGEPVLVNAQYLFRVTIHFHQDNDPHHAAQADEMTWKVRLAPTNAPARAQTWFQPEICCMTWKFQSDGTPVIWQKNLHRRMGKKPFITKKLAFLDTKYEICVMKREKKWGVRGKKWGATGTKTFKILGE